MSSRVGVASQEVYFCASDSTRSTSFASNFLTIGPPAFTSLVVNVPAFRLSWRLSGFIFSSRIRYSLVSYTHLHPKNCRWNFENAKKISSEGKPRILFSNLLHSQIPRPRPSDP